MYVRAVGYEVDVDVVKSDMDGIGMVAIDVNEGVAK